MKDRDTFFTYISLALAVLFWGLSFVATKVALQSFSPFCLIFLRFFAASLFFGALLLRTGFPLLSRQNILSLLLLAVMQPGLYFTFETIGLQYTSATKTSLIIATIPMVVLVLSAWTSGGRIPLVSILGVTGSMIGVCLLVFGGEVKDEMGGMLLGDLMIFGAVLSASAYMILIRRMRNTFTSLQLTGMQVIFGALLFFPAFLFQLPDLSVEKITRESLVALAALTVFATIGAFLCYNYALTRIPATQAAVCINGIPLVTAAAAWLLLDETLSALQLTGGAVVLAAVLLTNRSEPKEKIELPMQKA